MDWLVTCIFGASCDGWPWASKADATKVLCYVFIVLRNNQDLGGTDALPFICESVTVIFQLSSQLESEEYGQT